MKAQFLTCAIGLLTFCRSPIFASTPPLCVQKIAADDTRERLLRGRVYDRQSGEGLPFATLLIAEGGYGTVADIAGRYALSVKTVGVVRLKVSCLGYATREIVIQQSH